MKLIQEYKLSFPKPGNEIITDQEVYKEAMGRVELALDKILCGPECLESLQVVEEGRKSISTPGDLSTLTVEVSVQVTVDFVKGFKAREDFTLNI